VPLPFGRREAKNGGGGRGVGAAGCGGGRDAFERCHGGTAKSCTLIIARRHEHHQYLPHAHTHNTH
jgi:hypothetical protein